MEDIINSKPQRNIQAGEKEIVLASEEVQLRNVTAIRDYSVETRKLVNNADSRSLNTEKQLAQLLNRVNELTKEINLIKAKEYMREND